MIKVKKISSNSWKIRTQKYHIENGKVKKEGIKSKMENNFKSGFVAILGRTNVGKSTLLNAIVKEKVAIMTNKPQTTRTAIKAIVNRKNSQIIFIDTPGIHKPKSKLRRNIARYSL